MFIKLFSFNCFLDEMYTRTNCLKESLMKMAENVQRFKQNAFSNKKNCCNGWRKQPFHQNYDTFNL